jgi:Kef-type K+ transport system membrane component KefB
MGSIFLEITVVIGLATLLAVFFRFFKQPPIIAYVLTGIIMGPLGIVSLHNTEVLDAMAQFGITFLLFMLGLELRLDDLKSVGKVAALAGFGQVIITGVVGFGLSVLLGFTPLASVYISIALAFSSTIIIVKLLSDKRDINSLYGRITVGILLVQDFVAIFALIILAGLHGDGGSISPLSLTITIVKGICLIAAIAGLSKTILPKIIKHISHSSELLFLFSLAWVFGLAAFVSSSWVGFSIEIGGFLAGLSLSNSVQHFQIASRIRSLRDFFITIFFITLGMEMVFSDTTKIIFPAIVLSLFVLIGTPIVVLIVMGFLGFKRRTSFLTGITLAQISEFSLIVIFIGNQLGHVPDSVVTLITLVGITTFISSTYLILYGNVLYKRLHSWLRFFEKRSVIENMGRTDKELMDHTVLIGANRAGEHILEALLKKKHEVIVVEFDPEIVSQLKSENIPVLFGDIADIEIQEAAQIKEASLIISTISDSHDNLILLESLKKLHKKPHTIILAQDKDDALDLYRHGAEYVVIPHFSGGMHVSEIIAEDKYDHLAALKDKSIKQL